ncbi:MAG TPA: HD domain-containing phosphohydrolase [Solirubrobacteraceae bacterium]|nr:HD domain-containing phosphohydrolase [Solirubrobacteraceae bacterium]
MPRHFRVAGPKIFAAPLGTGGVVRHLKDGSNAVRGITQAGYRSHASQGSSGTRDSHDPAGARQPPDATVLKTPNAAVSKSKLARMGMGMQDNSGAPPSQNPWVRLAPWGLLLLLSVYASLVTSGVLSALSVLLLACIAVFLGWRVGNDRRVALEREIGNRSNELRRALTELEIAQAETVRRLSMAVEFRDEDTGAHIERIGRFSTLLAEQMSMEPDFLELLGHAAPLHDVGKVAIPDAILLKPGSLTPEERAIVETHAEEGYRLLRGSSSSILDLAATIALSHHEKWDGSGYPRGLAGESIPIEGRIVAIADVFDALTSDRVYRKAFPVEKAVEMMLEQRALHFDPLLLDAFMEVLGATGPDARAKSKPDPRALIADALDAYTIAMERGDAESAETTIAQAIEDGLAPATLHGEVIAPAMDRIGELGDSGELDAEAEQLAAGITRRILATMYRYMLGATEPTRERVLLAGVESPTHKLSLQMVHDQLSAAGFQTTLDTDLTEDRLSTVMETKSPELIVLGASDPAEVQALERIIGELRKTHPAVPIVLGGAVLADLPRRHQNVQVLERIDESVPAVEQLLTARSHALG